MSYWDDNSDREKNAKLLLYPLLLLLYVNIAMILIFVTYLICNAILHLFSWINKHIF